MNRNTERLERYYVEYSSSHKNPSNKMIHLVAVPLIFFSVLGMLIAIPTPSWFLFGFDWSSFFIFGALTFYYSFRNSRLMFVVILYVLVQLIILNIMKPHLFVPCLVIFILSWIAQFYGHHIEGKKPAFFRDLFFLLIGPLWVLRTAKLLK